MLMVSGDATLHLAKVRQDVTIGPPFGSHPFPLVVIVGGASKKDKSVYRTRSAKYLSPDPGKRSVGNPWIRLGSVPPCIVRVHDRFAETHRDVKPRASVSITGLNQAQIDIPVFRQPPATTQPADPAPTTTTSKLRSNSMFFGFMQQFSTQRRALAAQDQERSFEKITVPDAANIPPIPWASETFTLGTCAGAVPLNCRTHSCMANIPYMPVCV
jgi:hypothetical protein